MSAGTATAVGAPTPHAVYAAPSRILEDLHFLLRRMLLQIFGVVGDLREPLRFDVVERVGQGHVAVRVMVSIGFTVGCERDQLRPIAPSGGALKHPSREAFAVV